ncbi:MAG: hypothetical protein Tsb0013_10610 [Phycisphaerales bacterium]
MSHTTGPISDPDSHVDEWFKHDPNEPHHQEAHGKFNNTGIFLTLLITIVGTFGVAWAAIKWTNHLVYEQEAKVVETSTRVTNEQYEALGRWQDQLHGGPEWIDQTAGTVSIPLDIATRHVLDRYANAGP